MVNVCRVKGCKKESYPGCGLSFHRFPKDEEIKKKWLKLITGKITKTSVICDLHFKREDFRPYCTRKILKLDAVPSIFPFIYTQDASETNVIEKMEQQQEGSSPLLSADENGLQYIVPTVHSSKNSKPLKEEEECSLDTDSGTSDVLDAEDNDEDVLEQSIDEMIKEHPFNWESSDEDTSAHASPKTRLLYKKNDVNIIKSIAFEWAEKLTRLRPEQRLLAEKAIDDILFEAELGCLNSSSVKINETEDSASKHKECYITTSSPIHDDEDSRGSSSENVDKAKSRSSSVL